MIGKCADCKDYQRTIPDYCCLLCAVGLTKNSDNVIQDPFTGIIYIEGKIYPAGFTK